VDARCVFAGQDACLSNNQSQTGGTPSFVRKTGTGGAGPRRRAKSSVLKKRPQHGGTLRPSYRDIVPRGDFALENLVSETLPSTLTRLGCEWLFRRTHGSMPADGRFPAHIRDMAIPCPKCTVRAAIGIEGEFVFFGGQCIVLLGTRYVNKVRVVPDLIGGHSAGS
jgi:hypothetical protein